MVLRAPIFTKALFTQYTFVEISCNEFYPSGRKIVAYAGRISFRSSIHSTDFFERNTMFNGSIWRFSAKILFKSDDKCRTLAKILFPPVSKVRVFILSFFSKLIIAVCLLWTSFVSNSQKSLKRYGKYVYKLFTPLSEICLIALNFTEPIIV